MMRMRSLQDLKEFAQFTSKILTTEQMHAVDVNLREMGVSEAKLMENAGKAVSDFVGKNFSHDKRILVVCGLGNNGGDGFVAARNLSLNREITIALLGNKSEIKTPESRNLFSSLLTISNIAVVENAFGMMRELLKESDVVIDAIFGVGFHGKMDERVAEAIRQVNKSRTKVVAVDVPSGLSSSPENGNEVINADHTITFHKMKDVLVRSKNAGKVSVVDVGIPIEAELICGKGELELAARPRNIYSGKHDNGRTIIIGGNDRFHGAPILASISSRMTLAALRVGLGYAVTCVPQSVAPIAKSISPNLIVCKFAGENLSMQDAKMLKAEIDKAQSVVIGPGLGKDEDSQKAAAELIKYSVGKGKRIIVDADSIFSLRFIKKKLGEKAIITPNDKEFLSLSKTKLDARDLRQRVKAAMQVANKLGTNVILKGHESIITDGTRLKISQSKTAALATFGTGDILGGILGGYAALNDDMFLVGAAGACLLARAGDEMYKQKGNHGIASDLVELIPTILKEFDKNVD